MLALTAFWGASFTIVKGALDDSDPFTFLALRFAVGSVAAGLIAGRQLLSRSLWRPGVTLGVFLFLGFLTQTWGLATTTPGRSAFITGLFVVLVPFTSWVLFRRRPHASAFVAAALAVFGLYWLTGARLLGGFTVGDALTLACAVAYAVHMVLTERYAATQPAVPLATLQLFVVALCSPSAVLPLVDRHVVVTTDSEVAVLVAGIVSTALAIALQMWAQTRISAVRTALIVALEPVFSTAWSVFRGRDTLEPRSLLGGALIIVAVLISVARKV